jgi:hypothetical protein
MRLPRMTTRRWMVAVALAGLAMGRAIDGVRLKRRHDDFTARAQHHEQIEAMFRSWGRTTSSRLKYLQPDISQNRDYHAAMANKYRHAARYPWLPVEPDQEEPEWPPSVLIPQFR